MSLRDLVARLPVTVLPKPKNTGNAGKGRGRVTVTAFPPLPDKTQRVEVRPEGAGFRLAIVEALTEKSGRFMEDGHAAEEADRQAMHLVQCRSCAHFTPHPDTPSAGIGRCAVDGPALSRSPDRTERGLAAWPQAPRYCTRWRDSGIQQRVNAAPTTRRSTYGRIR